MAPLFRLLMALSILLLGAGAVAAGTHGSWSPSPSQRGANPRSATTVGNGRPTTGRSTAPSGGGPATTRSPSPSTTSPVGSVPGSATLAAGLITPTDMGGYYRIVASAAAALLDSAPCLAGMQSSPAQAGRALSALLGPDYHSLPTIVEVVASYPGEESRTVFDALARSIGACHSFSFGFGGAQVVAALQPSSIPAVGDADEVWSGPFTYSGSRFAFQIGLVLDGPKVLGLMWIDSVPGSDPVMGNFTSTVSLAIGKLA